MSMQTLTCLQIIEAFTAYTLVVLGLPWLVLHKRLAGVPAAERWLGYFLAGNFYSINLVFVLQFLHISNRWTLLAGTAAPFALPFLWKRRSEVRGVLRTAPRRAVQLLKGERKLKQELGKRWLTGRGKAGKQSRHWLRENGPELACMVLLAAAVFYGYGLGVIRAYGYKASDVVVHNYWINLLDENQIFHAGVYPHGFHCMIYYLEQVFGIPTYVLLRVFSLVETFYIHLAVLVSLRALCKSRYLPYLGTIGYALLACFGSHTYTRYSAALPQEYGMLFVFPAGVFAIRFFQDFARSCAAQEPEEKRAWARKVFFDLACFTVSFSLTITVHFYDTMIAGLFCVGIALAYWKQLFRWPYFKRIIGAGILSIALAVLPMAVGVLQGNPLQGSLYWGLSIINGTTDTASESTDAASESAAETAEAASDEEETVDTAEEARALTPREKLGQLYSQFRSYAVGTGAPTQSMVTNLLLIGNALLFLLGWVIWKSDAAQARQLWAAGWLDLLLMLLLEANPLHLPQMMDAGRASIFYAYTQALVWPLILDAVLVLLPVLGRETQLRNGASLLLTAVLLSAGVWAFGIKAPVGNEQIMESNQAMTCTANILRENERFNWTICSANEERQMILSEGRHEELITFLRELRKVGSGSVSVTIPTEYVYFYIEKMPIDYYGSHYDARGRMRISKAGASEALCMDSGLAPYSGTNRWVTMSHIYYWAQAFQKLHPDAMDVYYEDEDFVCYRLTQNVDSLYELAIDYGYNNP